MKKIRFFAVAAFLLAAVISLSSCSGGVADISSFDEIFNKNYAPENDVTENVAEINRLFGFGVTPFVEKKNADGVFSGEKIVLTGTLASFTRSQASKLIEERGGEVLSAVTKATTMVIAGESAGSKLEKAQKLGIKVISEEQFKSML